MARVTRRDGVVAACVWDHAGGQGPLGLFWQAARELDPDVDDESQLAGAREGHLAELFAAAGLREIEETTSDGQPRAPDLRGVVGAVHRRASGRRAPTSRASTPNGRSSCANGAAALLADAPFVVTARAWAARGLA